jgi:hypothetical protein
MNGTREGESKGSRVAVQAAAVAVAEPRPVEWRPRWWPVEPSESHWRPAETIADALRAARRLDCEPDQVEMRDADGDVPGFEQDER